MEKWRQPAVAAVLSRLPIIAFSVLVISFFLSTVILGGASWFFGLLFFATLIRLGIWGFRNFREWWKSLQLAWDGVPGELIASTVRLTKYWPEIAETAHWVELDAFGERPNLVARVFARVQGKSLDHGPQIQKVVNSPRGPVAHVATTIRVTASEIEKQAERIAEGWGVPTVTVTRPKPGLALLHAHIRDPLVDRGVFSISEFALRHPGGSPIAPLPLGVTEDGEVAYGSLHHTLVIGATGSGKGSALMSLVFALSPAASNGLVRFVACDPKNSEFRGREAIFGRIHVEPKEIAEAVTAVKAEMERRILASTSRSFKPSLENPALVLMFDEFTSAPTVFDPKEWKAVEADLRSILSRGRSLGVYVIAAGQEATKERLALRDLFPVRIALRLANSTETDMVLGQGATEEGALPHKIAPATPANNYRTAGIGFMLQEGVGFVSMRFPYAADEDLDVLCQVLGQ